MSAQARIHDATACLLGEGALWHPERGELWWFDILGRFLHGPGTRHALPEMTSAAGWVDRDTLLMAQRGALVRIDLVSGAMETVAPLDPGNPVVRSNDGRADPWGGFWVSTMGIGTEPKAGAIWRYFRGEMRRLVADVTIPNAICFAPDGSHAFYADTDRQIVWRQPLSDRDGVPVGEPVVHLDFRGTDLNPDGAVTDADGTIWIAFWGSGRIGGYAMDGSPVGEFTCPAHQVTCPAFGGDGFSTLYCTSAAAGIEQGILAREPGQGRTFAWDTGFTGRPEPRVIL